jgi:hypothetical protein
MDPEVREMLHINEEQRKYYEQADEAKEYEVNGVATNLWRHWRARALSVFEESQIDESLVELSQRWQGGDASSLKVRLRRLLGEFRFGTARDSPGQLGLLAQ